MRIVRRILVTGSRIWLDARPLVWAALDRELYETPPEDDLEILQGGAEGPDQDAAAWIVDFKNRFDPSSFAGVSGRQIDPDYARHGRLVAPLMRNQVMVDEKPARCLAFHMGESKGTADCIARALAAYIEVHVYRPGCPDPEIITPLF